MKRYVQFDEGDNPSDLTVREMKQLIVTLARRNYPQSLCQMIVKAVDNREVDLLPLAEELIAVDQEKERGVLIFETDASYSNVGESVSTGVGNAMSFIMAGMQEPTIDERIGQYDESVTTQQIESSTRPGLVHTVTLVKGIPVRCTCEGWNFNHGNCKHLRQAIRG